MVVRTVCIASFQAESKGDVSPVFPITLGETYRIARGIQFIFAFADALLHFGMILATSLQRGRAQACHEAVGIWVDQPSEPAGE